MYIFTIDTINMAEYLDFSKKGIHGMLNMSQFTGTKILDLSHNNIKKTFAHLFPPNVKEIDLSFAEMNYESITDENIPINITKLTLKHNKLNSFDGVEFSFLTYLDISSNNLSSFKIPPNIEHLDVSHNRLTMLHPLPSSLKVLNCSNNMLYVLPRINDGLITLICDNNNLSHINTTSETIQFLNASNNKLTTIGYLPYNLKELNLNNNEIHSIEYLPFRLKRILLDNNRLNYIPTFPNNVKYVSLKNNFIYSIEDRDIHQGIKYFDISGNHIRYIPKTITNRDGLSFKCQTEQFEDIPNIWGKSVDTNFDSDDDGYDGYSNTRYADNDYPRNKYYNDVDDEENSYFEDDDDYNCSYGKTNKYKNKNTFNNYPEFHKKKFEDYHNNKFNQYSYSPYEYPTYYDTEYSSINNNSNDPLCVSIYNTTEIII